MAHPRIIAALAACLALAPAAPAAAAAYVTKLAGVNENPSNLSPGSGSASLWISGDTMTLRVTFQDLAAPTTAAHIHCCAPSSANAAVATTTPSFAGFPLSATSGAYSRSFDLSDAATYSPGFLNIPGGGLPTGARDALLANLALGNGYLNIHTTAYPGGEIRGQWTSAPEPQTWALMIAGFGMAGGALRLRRAMRFMPSS